MGSFANTLFTILLGWLQGAVSAVWSAFTSEKGNGFLTWIGDHWILLAGILCIIGLAADLGVYLMRWKPLKVWKSFLFRNRDEEGEPEVRRKPAPAPKAYQRTFSHPAEETVPEPAAEKRQERYEAPDLSQWEEEPSAEQPEIQEQPAMVTGAGYVVPADSPYRRPAVKHEPVRQEPAQTDRGFQRGNGAPAARRPRAEGPETHGDRSGEPAESIRRSPAVSAEIARNRIPAKDDRPSESGISRQEEPFRNTAAEQTEPIQARPKRRRRLNVSDLFNNPEEELQEFDAPQDIIDRHKAYREPVYPRGWKQNGDNQHE